MRTFATLFAAALLLASCDSTDAPPQNGMFHEVEENYGTQALQLPTGYAYEVIFKEGETMVANASGVEAVARGHADFTAYIPIEGSSDHGFLYVNHESRDASDVFGDGGGGSILEVQRINGKWQLANTPKSIDFSGVGGTLRNCGGELAPNGNIFTAEETEPTSNKALVEGGCMVRDTSDHNGLSRYKNMGWMVEVNPQTGKAVRKLHRMGRFEHEDALCMPDGQTVYLTDDSDPAVFFKFVADQPLNYTRGQLFAYRQSLDAQGGDWIPLPMAIDSLMDIRSVAIRMGATVFVRHEWVERANGKLYIAETGNDVVRWQQAINKGGKRPHYFESKRDTTAPDPHTYNDPFGRLLEFDPATNRMRVLLEGGPNPSDDKHFASPDGLARVDLNGKPYLVISEDLIGLSNGRVSADAEAKGAVTNELYFLDLSNPNPSVDDLQRFLVGPLGCETTGCSFTPDGSTMFLSIQHPDPSNPAPFNTTCIVAITGFPAGNSAEKEEAMADTDH